MRRRLFVAGMGVTLLTPLVRGQQQARVFRVGYASVAPLAVIRPLTDAFEKGLREQGLTPGKDVVLDYRSVDLKADRYDALVRDLILSKPDVIITGLNQNTHAVRAATRTIPIVMMIGTNVVKEGLVAGLAKPGGNVTGFTWDAGEELITKQLEFLKAALPKVSRVAFLNDPPFTEEYRAYDEAAAKAHGLAFTRVELSDDIDGVFAEFARSRVQCVLSHSGSRQYTRRAEIAAAAIKHRIATIFPQEAFPEAGVLMSYGPNVNDVYRRGAEYVARILRGATPADLPVQQPTKLDLVVNLKTAKAIGLTLPSTLLLRADRVIE